MEDKDFLQIGEPSTGGQEVQNAQIADTKIRIMAIRAFKEDAMTDEQVLAQAMGKCWHTPIPANLNRIKVHYKCSKCGRHVPKNWSCTFTDPAERDELLQWAMRQEWWGNFDYWANRKWFKEENEIEVYEYLKWLLSAPDYRFVDLIVQYGKEVLWWD